MAGVCRHKQAKIIADPVWACGISACALEPKQDQCEEENGPSATEHQSLGLRGG